MAKKKRPQPRYYEPVEIEHAGTTYAGRFYVEDGWLYVNTDLGSKSAALHASRPIGLARILLREILGDTDVIKRT
ncbi:MAG TPA: hypothetical protein VNU97_07710 [Rhizomicrobium sp.]|jgi:hypothetical protein|nr:hypothetical protein [Rhizomicrobium sp.]